MEFITDKNEINNEINKFGKFLKDNCKEFATSGYRINLDISDNASPHRIYCHHLAEKNLLEITVPSEGNTGQERGRIAKDDEGRVYLLRSTKNIKTAGGSIAKCVEDRLEEQEKILNIKITEMIDDNKWFVVCDLGNPDIGKIITVLEVIRLCKAAAISMLLNNELEDKALATKPKKPKRTTVETMVFERSPYVVEYVKRRANGCCQLCNEKGPFFEYSTGKYYLECHHIKWLADDGSDTVDNAVALCPNCHRKMHIINDQKDVEYLTLVVKAR